MLLKLLFSLFTTLPIKAETFKEAQLRFPRVRAAAQEKGAQAERLFREQGLPYPPQGLFLRAFKKEKILELWAKAGADGGLKRVKEYVIFASSGELGPKRAQGDGQVPEGFYAIGGFNPFSNFHLSLRVDYPNASDKIRGRKGALGGDIFIHGNRVTIGCIPIEDEWIKELYWIAVEARSAGQREIPVHIFPARLDADGLRALEEDYASEPGLLDFWRELKAGFDLFEASRVVPKPKVDGKGVYRF